MSSIVKENNQGSWKYEGLEFKTMTFLRRNGFGFPTSLRRGNMT